MSTFKVLQMTDSAFVESVREMLPKAKFYPGKIGGVVVRQVVQQQFVFTVSN